MSCLSVLQQNQQRDGIESAFERGGVIDLTQYKEWAEYECWPEDGVPTGYFAGMGHPGDREAQAKLLMRLEKEAER